MWRNWNLCALRIAANVNSIAAQETVWLVAKILKIKQLYDPEIPFLSLYPKELQAGS